MRLRVSGIWWWNWGLHGTFLPSRLLSILRPCSALETCWLFSALISPVLPGLLGPWGRAEEMGSGCAGAGQRMDDRQAGRQRGRAESASEVPSREGQVGRAPGAGALARARPARTYCPP